MKLLELFLKRNKNYEIYKCPFCDKRIKKLMNVLKHMDKCI